MVPLPAKSPAKRTIPLVVVVASGKLAMGMGAELLRLTVLELPFSMATVSSFLVPSYAKV